MCRAFTQLAVPAAVCAVAVPAEARSYESVIFANSSMNIICNAYRFRDMPIGIRCDIFSGLKPQPARPPGCNLDYGGTVQMHVTGLSRIGCVGDINSSAKTSTLTYGTSFRFHGITAGRASAVCAVPIATVTASSSAATTATSSSRRRHWELPTR